MGHIEASDGQHVDVTDDMRVEAIKLAVQRARLRCRLPMNASLDDILLAAPFHGLDPQTYQAVWWVRHNLVKTPDPSTRH